MISHYFGKRFQQTGNRFFLIKIFEMKLLFCDNYCLLEKTLRNQNHLFSLLERLEKTKS